MKNKKKIIIIGFLAVIILSVKFGIYNLCLKGTYEIKEKILSYKLKDIEVNEEFFSQMSEKELLNYKILNNIDFFKTAKGTCNYVNSKKDYEFNVTSETIKYCVDTEKKLASNIEARLNRQNIYKDNQIIILNKNDRTYSIYTLNSSKEELNKRKIYDSEIVKKLKPNERFKGENQFIKRDDNQFIDSRNKALCAESIVFHTKNTMFSFASLLVDSDNWEIKGEEKYLERQAVSITINIKIDENDEFTDEYVPSKINAVIDKDTGIILSYTVLDENYEVRECMKTTSIEIDGDIDYSIFENITAGYEEDMR